MRYLIDHLLLLCVAATTAAPVCAELQAVKPTAAQTEFTECGCDASCCQECGDACRGCTCCRDVCCPMVEEVKEKKSCWKVNCEKVCVPAISLPWEPGGSPLTLFNCLRGHEKSSCGCECASCDSKANCGDTCCSCTQCCRCEPVRCGTVRAVHVLEEESRDVTKCKTKWEIKSVLPTCGNCCETRCDHAAGDSFEPHLPTEMR
jgi:hypothetical protein